MRRSLVLLSTLFVVNRLFTASALAARPDLEFKMDPVQLQNYVYNFPSGLRLVLQEDPNSLTVALSTLVDHGATSDPIGQEGTAHLLEHLWFRSHPLNKPSMKDTYDRLGAIHNAYTRPDTTEYVTAGPASALTTLLRMEALRLEAPLANVTQSDLDLEQAVVLKERMLHDREWPVVALQNVYQRLFPEAHPYHRVGKASEASLRSTTLESLHSFATNYYRPKAVTITVVGGTTKEDLAAIIARTFPESLLVNPASASASITQTASVSHLPPKVAPPPPPVDTAMARFPGVVDRPVLVVAWSLPAAFREDHDLMEIATGLLDYEVSDTVNSRMVFGIHQPHHYNQAGCTLVPGKLTSVALCTVTLGQGQSPEKVLELVLNTPTTLLKIGPEDFTKARWSLISHTLISAEEVFGADGRASRVAHAAHFRGTTAYIERLRLALSELKPRALHPLYFNEFNRRRAVTVLVEPSFSLEAAGGDVSAGASPEGRRSSAGASTFAGMTPEAVRTTMMTLPIGDLTSFTLDNGLEVQIFQNGSLPLVRSTLVFRGGSWTETKPGIELFSDLFTRVTANTLAHRLGVRWMSEDRGTHTYFGLNGSSANLPDQLFLMRRRLQDMAIDLTMSDKIVDFVAAGQNWINKTPEGGLDFWSNLRVLRQDHPKSTIRLGGYFKAAKSLSRKDLKDWNDAYYAPGNAVLVIVGKIQAEDAEKQVRAAFGDWSGPRAVSQKAPPPMPAPESPQALVLDYPDPALTRVRLTCQLQPLSATNREAMEVTRELVRREAWKRLRVDSGLTYSPHTSTQGWPGGTSLLTIDTTVPTEKAGAVVDLLTGITSDLASAPPSPGALQRAQSDVAARSPLALTSNGAVFQELLFPIVYGFGPEFLTERPNRLAAVTGEDIRTAMARCGGHESVVLMGQAARLMPQLSAEKLGYSQVMWRDEAQLVVPPENVKEFEIHF